MKEATRQEVRWIVQYFLTDYWQTTDICETFEKASGRVKTMKPLYPNNQFRIVERTSEHKVVEG